MLLHILNLFPKYLLLYFAQIYISGLWNTKILKQLTCFHCLAVFFMGEMDFNQLANLNRE